MPNAPEVEAAYDAVPEEQIAEIIDGELHVQPGQHLLHCLAKTRLIQQLVPLPSRHGEPDGWVLLSNPVLHFGPRPDKLQPDLAGWRRERMPEIPDVEALTLTPDWICEVLWPETYPRERARKIRVYRREGVAHLWLVSPRDRMAEVYQLTSEGYLQVEVYEGDVCERIAPFHEIELDLGALWTW
ncbi:Uma2 family endonuclease [Polyangium sp. 15x6]|uniref:Uma2 family endonuclease n=1 Tax=Polyangium sp. 15x6 TaxID=3042687 RepID=UPI00249A4FE0|nr:Uma2 family endonuclease [Polyangium sp. 15x6]MDI3286147.1 Uma2 family endonuclease [Polyangium sp. 15x6]